MGSHKRIFAEARLKAVSVVHIWSGVPSAGVPWRGSTRLQAL